MEKVHKLSTEERAQKGIFLAFQYPLEIPGVNTNIPKNFFKLSKKSQRRKGIRHINFFKIN